MSPSRGVTRLHLSHFRSYERYEGSFDCAPVILTGPNGAGKTNLLESLSFLIPGRGLRYARLSTVQRQGSPHPWAISCTLQDGPTSLHIGTGMDPEAFPKERRLTKVNGEKIKGQAALTEWVSMVWLTPQMDRLFMDAPQERRKFLDRLVYGMDPTHASRLSQYEKAVKERGVLLRQESYDANWMDSLEEILVHQGILITLKRQEILAQLMAVLTRDFPALSLDLHGTMEEVLATHSSPHDVLRRLLRESRERSHLTGRTSLGPHRSDLHAFYLEKNQPAGLCSTGEQKSMLLAIVMASAHLLSERTGAIPLLLLDEVIAHLDETRRGALCESLLKLNMQVWLTGTDAGLFEGLRGKGQFVGV